MKLLLMCAAAIVINIAAWFSFWFAKETNQYLQAIFLAIMAFNADWNFYRMCEDEMRKYQEQKDE